MRDEDKTKEQLIKELGELRKQSAQKVKEIEQTKILLQSIIDESGQIVYVKKEEDLSHVWLSNEFEKSLGIKREKILGKTNCEIFGEKTDAKFDATERDILAGKRTDIEESINGRIYWTKRFAIDMPTGKRYLCGTSIDITERKQAENVLRKYKLLFSQINDLAYITDDQGNITFLNNVFEELSGHKIEEFIGKPFSPLFDDDDLKVANEMYLRTLQGESPRYELRFKDTGKLLEYKNIPLQDDKGVIIGVMGISRDITERKQVEETLRRNEQLLRTLSENYPNSYLSVIDKDMRIGFTSGREFKKQGLDPNQFVGMSIFDLFGTYDTDTLEIVKNNYRKAFVGEEITFELYVNKQYQIYHIVPLLDNRGNIDQILSVVENVTDRKQLEKQLRESQKMEAIGTLAGGIAHEFNNLLAPILGFTEMLMRDKSENVSDYERLRLIQHAGNRAKSLVQQMLAYGRQSMSQRELVRLETLVEDTINLIKNTLPSNIYVKKEIEVRLPLIFGMPNEIRQVILNLCLNASHAMPDGGELTIHLKNGGYHKFINSEGLITEGNFVGLIVCDTGSGINQANMDRIFDPFFTTKGVGEGSGLGLSVVQGIMEQHQGFIDVDSKVGDGTTFHVYFPITQEKVKPPVVKTKPLSQGNERILLIDDEPMITNLTKNMLEELGYKVTEFLDCDEALKLFTEIPQDFDLVITDYGMPKMNGKQLTEKLKEIRPDISVILFTGYGDLIAREDIHIWGMNDLLLKPFELKELSEVVREVLNKRSVKA